MVTAQGETGRASSGPEESKRRGPSPRLISYGPMPVLVAVGLAVLTASAVMFSSWWWVPAAESATDGRRQAGGPPDADCRASPSSRSAARSQRRPPRA
ncbi:hypothetical protein ACFPK5_03235 [Streptomyces beijiangensis]|uniref:hypothetical protein n=1 Tax=Streptomyces beijiangensis TaxID=163361 RepID=UPI00360B4108